METEKGVIKQEMLRARNDMDETLNANSKSIREYIA